MAKSAVNRSELVREALRAGLSNAREIVDHIIKTHDVEVSDALVYNIKRTHKSTSSAMKKKKSGPKPTTSSLGEIVDHRPKQTGLTVEDIVAVRGLIGRLGVDGLQKLINALA